MGRSAPFTALAPLPASWFVLSSGCLFKTLRTLWRGRVCPRFTGRRVEARRGAGQRPSLWGEEGPVFLTCPSLGPWDAVPCLQSCWRRRAWARALGGQVRSLQWAMTLWGPGSHSFPWIWTLSALGRRALVTPFLPSQWVCGWLSALCSPHLSSAVTQTAWLGQAWLPSPACLGEQEAWAEPLKPTGCGHVAGPDGARPLGDSPGGCGAGVELGLGVVRAVGGAREEEALVLSGV